LIDLFRFSHHWSMCPVHSFLHNIQFEFMWNAFYFNLINTLIVHWILNVIMHPVHSKRCSLMYTIDLKSLYTYTLYNYVPFSLMYILQFCTFYNYVHLQLCTFYNYVHFTIMYILQLRTFYNYVHFTIMYILQLCTFIHLCTLYIYIRCKLMCTVHLCTLYTTL